MARRLLSLILGCFLLACVAAGPFVGTTSASTCRASASHMNSGVGSLLGARGGMQVMVIVETGILLMIIVLGESERINESVTLLTSKNK